ncbi:thiamine phosphate synthase [Paenibacillus sp. 19GGS1-52]|uniref:thiamine phosphate synthase n=1 Tax=Paenibacillus sp. 19GGS1-52 TaxID=2758563 RepID=UPI001EFA79B7|nr:thiamine phosphate synthase [Paenibacillus sp. 19GGS1-52]ULO05859.1 thiamine phosphate synthase [Paenibacillus sp. 19GGS1-52]
MVQGEIHLISDGKLPLRDFIEKMTVLHPLADYIHLREKHLSARELLSVGEQLLLAGIPAAKLFINDRIDVAVTLGAGGVQLAWHSLRPAAARVLGPRLRLGCSVHSSEEASEAARQGADYCLFGHVYDTASKPGQRGCGLELLADVVRNSAIPVIAIGGIKPSNVARVMEQGAAGIAVMSGICGAEDPVTAMNAYRTAMQRR